MRIVNRLPPRPIEGADTVLDGVVAEVASSNLCRFWPALTSVAGSNQTRIAFFMEWLRPPTPDDQAEVMAYTDKLMGKAPEVATEVHGDPTADQANVGWLRSGKKPKSRRTN